MSKHLLSTLSRLGPTDIALSELADMLEMSVPALRTAISRCKTRGEITYTCPRVGVYNFQLTIDPPEWVITSLLACEGAGDIADWARKTSEALGITVGELRDMRVRMGWVALGVRT